MFSQDEHESHLDTKIKKKLKPTLNEPSNSRLPDIPPPHSTLEHTPLPAPQHFFLPAQQLSNTSDTKTCVMNEYYSMLKKQRPIY